MLTKVTIIITAILLIAINYLFFLKRKKLLQNTPINPQNYKKYFAFCSLAWSLIGIVGLIVITKGNLNLLVVLAVSISILFISSLVYKKFSQNFNPLTHLERLFILTLKIFASTSIVVSILIITSLVIESIKFFQIIPAKDFLFGLEWNPQNAEIAPKIYNSKFFGVIPVFIGTIMVTMIALVVAIPIGILAAIYLAEFASRSRRKVLKPLIEVLSGIPTVVYGYFAAFIVAPFLVRAFSKVGITLEPESVLVSGIVIGVMIIPFITSIFDDVLAVVPKTLRDGAVTMGATETEAVLGVVLPAAIPGLISSIILAFSRAVGETMIVVMAAGMVASNTVNPFEANTTATVQIVNMLVGDSEFDSPKTLSAFAISLVLFFFTLLLNMIAVLVQRKYRRMR